MQTLVRQLRNFNREIEDDDEEGDEDEGWGWSVTPPDDLGVPLPPRFHHHHHHRHGIHDMLNMMQAGLPGDLERGESSIHLSTNA